MEQDASTTSVDRLALKVPEPEVSSSQPWVDDKLSRRSVADRLTNLIYTQSVPLVIAVHGQWGTGKTFMLERWRNDLSNQGFHAIYFNAWEDDFCDDPLLAIIGQLSDHFKGSGFKDFADRVSQIAVPLLRQNALGVLNKATGLDFNFPINGDNERNLLQEYLVQRKTKDDLKDKLTDLSKKVFDETEHPMVFIIDELDRCRPTFAIELLERIKHVFDVPNLVFVLGVNRDELCKSLQSVYGDITAEVYVQRFFDFEFALPDGDSIEFCKHLFDKFGLGDDSPSGFPELWSYFGLSLRQMDYCTRLLCLTIRKLTVR